MHAHRVLGATALLVLAALAVPAAYATTGTARYTVTDLGALGTGDFSVATAVNNAGQVVGYSNPTATTAKPNAPKKPAKPAAAPARQGAAQSATTPPVLQR